MKFIILTLFPEMLRGFYSESIIGRAVKNKKIVIEINNLRDWGIGKRKQVDDVVYGGGAGMLLRPDVVVRAIRDIKNSSKVKAPKTKVILLTPQGERYTQKIAKELAEKKENLLLICGHYEGIDERVRDYVDMELSIGDFVLTGGELAAAVVVDSVARFAPGVLGDEASHQEESFLIEGENLLEYPQFTRPEEFEGKKVPEILKSGNHQEIKKWRKLEAVKKTKKLRPDLI